LALALHLLVGLPVTLSVSHLYPFTSTPIERAVPAMIFDAASMSFAFRSGFLRSAIWRTWSIVIVPTLFTCGSPEPLGIPAASLIRTAAGGVLVMKSKGGSPRPGISPGLMRRRCGGGG